jgi:hypothetical protein
MNDDELDQLLNRWKAPPPSGEFRARVLAGFPPRERLGMDGPLRSDARLRWSRALRWAAAAAAAVCIIAVGAAQSGSGTLEHLAGGISRLRVTTMDWIGDLWVGHVALAFRQSNPRIYIEGELRSDVEFGGSGVGVWVRIPEEGKYLIGLRRTAFEGPVPPRAGRFDGHALEFQAGSRTVRIESTETYGFHERLPVYVMGPVQR